MTPWARFQNNQLNCRRDFVLNVLSYRRHPSKGFLEHSLPYNMANFIQAITIVSPEHPRLPWRVSNASRSSETALLTIQHVSSTKALAELNPMISTLLRLSWCIHAAASNLKNLRKPIHVPYLPAIPEDETRRLNQWTRPNEWPLMIIIWKIWWTTVPYL